MRACSKFLHNVEVVFCFSFPGKMRFKNDYTGLRNVFMFNVNVLFLPAEDLTGNLFVNNLFPGFFFMLMEFLVYMEIIRETVIKVIFKQLFTAFFCPIFNGILEVLLCVKKSSKRRSFRHSFKLENWFAYFSFFFLLPYLYSLKILSYFKRNNNSSICNDDKIQMMKELPFSSETTKINAGEFKLLKHVRENEYI